MKKILYTCVAVSLLSGCGLFGKDAASASASSERIKTCNPNLLRGKSKLNCREPLQTRLGRKAA